MTSEYLARFIERLPGMSDDDILMTQVRMKAAPEQYELEAISAVENEVTRRRLTAAEISEAARRASQDALDAIQEDADRLAQDGYSAAAIEARLRATGLDDATAVAVASRACDMPSDEERSAGRRNMAKGAAICLLGVVASAVSYYFAATSPGGGRNVITWGLVLVGIAQFFRGARQRARARDVGQSAGGEVNGGFKRAG